MEKSTKLYRLMDHDSDFRHTRPIFEPFTLEEYNRRFDTAYTSIEDAVEDKPEYLFTEEEVKDWASEYNAIIF